MQDVAPVVQQRQIDLAGVGCVQPQLAAQVGHFGEVETVDVLVAFGVEGCLQRLGWINTLCGLEGVVWLHFLAGGATVGGIEVDGVGNGLFGVTRVDLQTAVAGG